MIRAERFSIEAGRFSWIMDIGGILGGAEVNATAD
ncbi:MAG: hypothetical protein QOF78_1732 [Phycisphaerales bacterium]|jgi:hypothetical protein|nr:hypothetical protein [Phycisphaerales bacterium]